MRRLTLIGVCLAVVAAFAAVSVASASAAEPALYECVLAPKETVTYEKKPGKPPITKEVYTGDFKKSNCTKPDTKDKVRIHGPHPGPEGKYAALELSHAAPFTGTGGGANLNIKGVGGVACLGASFSGKFTGPKSSSDIVATFTKCEFNGAECASAGQSAGTIVANPLVGGVGYVAGKGTGSPKVGADLSPESGVKLAEFTCTNASFTDVIAPTGSVIGEASPVNSFTNTATFTFKQVAVGINEWVKFQEWLPAEEDRLTAHICQTLGCEPVASGFTAEASEEGTFTGHLSNAGEELEVKA